MPQTLMKITYVALSILDFLLTALLVTKYGPEVESNPVAHWVLLQGGIPGMAILKLSTILFVLVVMRYAKHKFIAPFACVASLYAVLLGIYSNFYI